MSEIKLYFNNNQENLERLKKCPSLYQEKDGEPYQSNDSPSILNAATYDPPYYLYNSHIMNYYVTFKMKRLHLKRDRDELVNEEDGGTVSLDWYNFGNEFDAKTPTIVICHGLTGGSHEPYIQYFAKYAYDTKGFRSVVFNNRGCAGNKITADTGYCGIKVDDLEMCIRKIQEKYPEAPLFLAGFSLGSVILVNYLNKHQEDSPFLAHLCISNPMDMNKSMENLMSTYLNSYLYGKGLAVNIKKLLYKFGDRLDKYATKEQIKNAASIKDLDDLVTSKMFGFEDGDHYYREASSSNHIEKLQKPILFINASDDTISPPQGMASVYEKFKNNPNTMLALTKRGGHLGFISYRDWTSWADKAGVEYFSTFLENK
ncbi:alpha/beta hydrolase fold-1 domain-containing protein [Heterostelium album PN500]|uniref:Alpha/beta hydrolase fold-1 domain-containing protein n=1 Tax=Heterostelium pallidum (strain ATCC 26659 / Pp 5 / PN500) TaxID=670386 RepID=D3BTR9_HETP5|nr:alpha/beta hydrolase fold-1 domain-containing protein [Heterostelium album PN500]EFA75105.1 alpha/beta hydrolase fold-1 domain-containing protein [Heterostelium album PN500]|eukprot:XP_020427239.1 alpha/beta hydrolase fold-1 domain-containing protein [Heterostelium album PN500]